MCRCPLFEETELTGKANAKIKQAVRELRDEGAFEALERLREKRSGPNQKSESSVSAILSR